AEAVSAQVDGGGGHRLAEPLPRGGQVRAPPGKPARAAAAEAGAAERQKPVAVGPLHRPQHGGAVAGAADGDEQVARPGQVLQLLHEDALEALVVAPGEDVRRVVRQAQDAQALLPVVVEVLAAQGALAQVLAEVGGVGAAAAVAAQKDGAAVLVAVVDGVGQRPDLALVEPRELLGDAVEELARAQLGSQHARGPWSVSGRPLSVLLYRAAAGPGQSGWRALPCPAPADGGQ